MINMIQRDKWEILDAMLVAINSNDKLYLNHQHNVIPVAQAKNMGIIAMKVFSDGAMYSKYANWTRDHEGVIRTVGTRELPSKPLIEYALSTPGIHTAIIGIGQIADDNLKCQLVQNYYASQIKPEGLSEKRRTEIEESTRHVKDGKTNYFQLPHQGLTPPQNVHLKQTDHLEIRWDTAYASNDPLSHYEVLRDGKPVAKVSHQPQVTREPFIYTDKLQGKTYKVVAVDKAGNRAEGENLQA
jgi:predicted aldo/keto reductase-like oxidoreductase